MNPWNSLWVFCEDVRYTISLKLFLLECEVSSLIVGVCCGTWELYYVCECMSWVAESLSSVCGYICHMRSLFCFHLYITEFVSGFLVCVCQGCEISSICGYMFQFVRSLHCLWVDDMHRTCASLLFWMYGQGLEISTSLELYGTALSYLLVYVSGWGVFNCVWRYTWGCWNKGPWKMSMP